MYLRPSDPRIAYFKVFQIKKEVWNIMFYAVDHKLFTGTRNIVRMKKGNELPIKRVCIDDLCTGAPALLHCKMLNK